MCKSGCHGCPALHRRTGPLAPHDNHSLAEGHRFGPTLASNLLLCCWSAHKSLASRARTLLGVLGHATLNFVAVATLLFCFFCGCPKFLDLAKQRRKMFLGVSEVGNIDFALYFCWLCVFFVIFHILLLRSRDVSSSGGSLTCLSTDYACGSSQWNAEEEDRIVRAVQAVGAKSRGDRGVQLTEYGMAPQVYDRMIQTLGAEAPETDVFASQDVPLLRKCRRHWHRGD